MEEHAHAKHARIDVRLYHVMIGGRDREVRVDDDGRSVFLDNGNIPVRIESVGERSYSVHFEEQAVRVVAVGGPSDYHLLVNGKRCTLKVESERSRLLKRFVKTGETIGEEREVVAPMPALVVKVSVAVGEKVRTGQGLVVLEAMKMENEIRCPSDGVVHEISVKKGQAVEKGELLMKLQ